MEMKCKRKGCNNPIPTHLIMFQGWYGYCSMRCANMDTFIASLGGRKQHGRHEKDRY